MNTGTITVTWDEDGNVDYDTSDDFNSRALLIVGAGLYAAALANLRKRNGDRWAGDAWNNFKNLVEHKVFTYTVRAPRWTKDWEGTDG